MQGKRHCNGLRRAARGMKQENSKEQSVLTQQAARVLWGEKRAASSLAFSKEMDPNIDGVDKL